jgi:thiosulfate dehydrogenase
MRLPTVSCARPLARGVPVLGLVVALGCTSQPEVVAPSGIDARAASVAGGAHARRSTPWPAAVPDADTLPDDAHGRLARRGRAMLAATRDSLPAHVGNALRCTSCHLDDGRRADALPWVGVLARFPQYRARNAQVNQIEDRVNDCLERSMAGRALPHDSDAMRAIVAYFAYLSRGVPTGTRLEGQGAPPLAAAPSGEREDGALVYARTCARCHGAQGEGTPQAPPLWGDGSYSIGAGMGRPRTAAAFIRANMPHDQPPGTITLSEAEALAVATYINAQARPDFARRAGDWPFGGAPADVPYDTPGRTAARAVVR